MRRRAAGAICELATIGNVQLTPVFLVMPQTSGGILATSRSAAAANIEERALCR